MPEVPSETKKKEKEVRKALNIKRADSFDFLLEDKVAAIVISIAFGTIIVLMSVGRQFYDDALQRFEAFAVAVMAVISTQNFRISGKKILAVENELKHFGVEEEVKVGTEEQGETNACQETLIGSVMPSFKNQLWNNLFTVMNVVWFVLALFSLAWKDHPYFYVLMVFMIFWTFTASNWWQANKLRARLQECKSRHTKNASVHNTTNSASNPDNDFFLRESGAFLLEVTTWLRSDNGPSMMAYAVLIVIMGGVFAFYSSQITLLGAYSAGAATFHLTVSVFVFLVGLRNNPWEHVVKNAKWMEGKGEMLTGVTNCAEKSADFWKGWWRACILTVISVLAILTVVDYLKAICVLHF